MDSKKKEEFSIELLDGETPKRPVPSFVQESKLKQPEEKKLPESLLKQTSKFQSVKKFFTQPIYLNTNKDPRNVKNQELEVLFNEPQKQTIDDDVKFVSAKPYWTIEKVILVVAFGIGLYFFLSHAYNTYMANQAMQDLDAHFDNIKADLKILEIQQNGK